MASTFVVFALGMVVGAVAYSTITCDSAPRVIECLKSFPGRANIIKALHTLVYWEPPVDAEPEPEEERSDGEEAEEGLHGVSNDPGCG